jgi:hypothetical protein
MNETIEVSGVRSSCETMARNWFLASSDLGRHDGRHRVRGGADLLVPARRVPDQGQRA